MTRFQLLLEGPLVGRGYLNDEEKTAKAFINDPIWLFQGASGYPGRRGRLYKTGDLVRYNPDGTLYFIGRKDAQVKIHGQRVELEEVEYWTQKYVPSVERVISEVVLVEGKSSSPVLVTFLVQPDDNVKHSDGDGQAVVTIVPAPVGVEDNLARHVPAYMIPTVYFSLNKVPVTAAGKTDRRRLREIGASFSRDQITKSQRVREVSMKRQPRTYKEKEIQKIWAKVLGIDDLTTIGADDNFIHLGGNSMSVMKVVSQARKAGFQLTVADIFSYPLLHEIADHATLRTSVAHDAISSHQASANSIQSFAQECLWRLEQVHPGHPISVIPWVVRLRGPLYLEALNTALRTLQQRHEILRTVFETSEDTSIQRIIDPGWAPLSEIDISSEEALMLALQQDRMTPFNLQVEPGWKVAIYRLDGGHHVLSIVMHHIVSDGWSFDVLRRELATFYSAAKRGEEPLARANTLPIQYRDFSLWQRRDQVDVHQRQLDFWENQLQSSHPAVFPCDKPRPSALSGRTAAQKLTIEGSLYEALQRGQEEQGVTMFVILLASLGFPMQQSGLVTQIAIDGKCKT
jgi:aryl carrier-like protein